MDKKIITVTSGSGLKNAIDKDYEIILVGGKYAQQVARKIKKNENADIISNFGIFIGTFFFGPALFAGLAGKFFTRKMKRYYIADMDDEFVAIKKKIK